MRRTHIEKAKKICREELKMREYVFQNNGLKREKKVKEMEYVINILNECVRLLPEEQRSLFGE